MGLKLKFKKAFSFIHKLSYGSFGKKSAIIKPMMINGKKNIHIGNKVLLREGARLEAITKWQNTSLNSSITIGDNTVFEQEAHIIAYGKVKIGSNCLVSARCFITSCHHSYNEIDVPILNQKLISSDVEIKDNCFIGMDVKIFPGVTIGKNVIIGANSIVTSSVDDYSVVAGVPARVIKKYDFNKKEWVKVEGE